MRQLTKQEKEVVDNMEQWFSAYGWHLTDYWDPKKMSNPQYILPPIWFNITIEKNGTTHTISILDPTTENLDLLCKRLKMRVGHDF